MVSQGGARLLGADDSPGHLRIGGVCRRLPVSRNQTRLPDNARRVGIVQRLEGLRSLGFSVTFGAKGSDRRRARGDPATKKSFAPEVKIGLRIGKRALANGLLLRFDPHWIAFGPPLIVTEQDIDAMVAILEQSIREVLRAL
jgi:hypothetical protein